MSSEDLGAAAARRLSRQLSLLMDRGVELCLEQRWVLLSQEVARVGRKLARSGGPLPPPSPCWERAPRSSSPGGGTLATSSACSCFCVLVALIKACVFEEAGLGEGSSEREPT